MATRPLFPRKWLQRGVSSCCAVALLAGAALPPALAQNQLPALGDSVSEDFGVGAERNLGEQIMRSIRRDPDYIDDPVLVDYLQSLWQPLVRTAREKGDIGEDTTQRFAWEPFLVRDRSVNAFALPGGFVGVHLGLIAMTSSSDELASVLAHELSHVTQRHIARGMSNSRRQSLLSAAAMILGVLAASRASSADAANAVIVGGQAASIQGQLNFSRDMEREADRMGYGLLTGAGFAPSGMAAMFEKLDQASRLNDSGGFPYLRKPSADHPTHRRSPRPARPGAAGGPGGPARTRTRPGTCPRADGHGCAGPGPLAEVRAGDLAQPALGRRQQWRGGAAVCRLFQRIGVHAAARLAPCRCLAGGGVALVDGSLIRPRVVDGRGPKWPGVAVSEGCSRAG